MIGCVIFHVAERKYLQWCQILKQKSVLHAYCTYWMAGELYNGYATLITGISLILNLTVDWQFKVRKPLSRSLLTSYCGCSTEILVDQF